MSIMSRISGAYRALVSETTVPTTDVITRDTGNFAFPSSSLTYSLGMWPSSTGVPVSPVAALQAATCYACIKRLAEDMAKLPIRIRKRSPKGGWVDADHPILDLLSSPNAWQTRYELISYLIASLQMRGNGYLYVDRRSDGSPKMLLPLLPDRVSVLLTDLGDIYYKITAPQLGNITLNATYEDVIHIRNISIDAGIMGVSPIACSQDVMGLAIASQRHGALLFKQGSMVGGVLESPQRLSQEAAMRMAQSWQAAYSGGDQAHKVAVLEEGVRFNPISLSPEDAQLLETQKWSAEQICRVFGVPPWLVGLPVPTGTYSNVEQSQIQYVTNTLSGLAAKVEQELARVLLFRDERKRYDISFDFDAMLRGDMKSRMEAYQIATLNGYLSINEIREREGLESIGAAGDEHRVPTSLSPAATPTDNTQETDVSDAAPSETAE